MPWCSSRASLTAGRQVPRPPLRIRAGVLTSGGDISDECGRPARREQHLTGAGDPWPDTDNAGSDTRPPLRFSKRRRHISGMTRSARAPEFEREERPPWKLEQHGQEAPSSSVASEGKLTPRPATGCAPAHHRSRGRTCYRGRHGAEYRKHRPPEGSGRASSPKSRDATRGGRRRGGGPPEIEPATSRVAQRGKAHASHAGRGRACVTVRLPTLRTPHCRSGSFLRRAASPSSVWHRDGLGRLL